MNATMKWFGNPRTEKGVTTREFTLDQSNKSIPGVLWTPETPSPGNPLILLGHGASGDRFQAPVRSMAYRMVRHYNFFAMAIDGPIHGRRTVGDGARGAFSEEWKRPGTVNDMIADWKLVIDN